MGGGYRPAFAGSCGVKKWSGGVGLKRAWPDFGAEFEGYTVALWFLLAKLPRFRCSPIFRCRLGRTPEREILSLVVNPAPT